MKTLLICHDGADLHREGMARWLASFSTLTGVVVLQEGTRAAWRRARREFRRVGALRFADALAFRLYYKLFLASRDKSWLEGTLRQMCRRYPPLPDKTPILYTSSANSPAAEQFIQECAPDIMLALCKTLLKPAVFSLIPAEAITPLMPLFRAEPEVTRRPSSF